VDGAIMSIKLKIEALVEATMTFWRGCCNDEQISGHIEVLMRSWRLCGTLQGHFSKDKTVAMEREKIPARF
jgi:hypothetical protein